jgi:phenylacetate-CoA ligase
VVRRVGTLDEIEVVVEAADDAGDATAAVAEAATLIKSTIGCTMTVTLVAVGEAPRSDGGKIQRVRDLR